MIPQNCVDHTIVITISTKGQEINTTEQQLQYLSNRCDSLASYLS